MIWTVLQLTTIIALPFLSQKIARIPVFKTWLSPVVICYAAGILLGNIEPFPIQRELSRTVSEVAILFAIPLLLYATNLPQWLRYANKTLLSFALCALSGLLANVLFGFLFRHYIADSWRVAGMVAGLYTGGTPNMQGVAFALNAPDTLIILVNAADIFTGGVYLVFLTSVAPRIFGAMLPAFQAGSTHASLEKDFTAYVLTWPAALRGIALTVGVVGLSIGLTWALFGSLDQTIFIILMLTSLSVAASFVPKIRQWPGTFETGELFLLSFCVAIGSLANFREILGSGHYIVAYVGAVLLCTVVLHLLFCRLFKIDRDTMMLTSTAALYGPAFVGQIATVIGNKELVFSGMAMGLLGYAIGNYWGIGLAYLLHFFANY